MHKMTTEEIIKRIKKRVGDSKAFLTFDIDFIDPSYAAGTGTPVLGGFSTTQALEIIRGLKELNIIGYDLVEVAPQYDQLMLLQLQQQVSCMNLYHILHIRRNIILNINYESYYEIKSVNRRSISSLSGSETDTTL